MNRQRIEDIYYKKYSYDEKDLQIFYGDLADSSSLNRLIKKCRPDEVYNLAAQSHVGVSFKIPEYTCDVTGLGTVRILDALKDQDIETKFYQASSSEMFGNSSINIQNEETPFLPQSPYACAKVAAYYACRYYRKTYGMFVSTAIMFNHDSPRRTEEYLLNKICRSAIRVAKGEQETIVLGNLDLCVDIGYAREYMKAAHAMLQLDEPDDFVIGTGTGYRIGYLTGVALEFVGVDPSENSVVVNPKFDRSNQPELVADNSKARRVFGFHPICYGDRLLRKMIKELRKCK